MFDPWRWVFDPGWLAGIVVFGGWYLWLARVHRIPPLRRAGFLAGLLLVAAALLSPIEHVALNSMLSFHLLQNVMLADWAPPLLVLGFTPALAAVAERHRPVRIVTRPAVALALWLAVWYGVHIPIVYEYGLDQDWALGVEHLLFLTAGLAFWWPVLVPGRMRPGPRLVYLGAAFFLASPVALVIALSGQTLYEFYDTTPHLFGWTPLDDQQIGGMLMAVEQSVILFVAAFYALTQFMAEDEEGPDALGSSP